MDEVWTLEALKEHFERRFDDAEKAVSAALAAAEKMGAVSESNSEKWRANANEWRAAMMDREQRFASRPEMEAELKAIRTEIIGLRESRAEGVGGKAAIAAVVTLVMVLAAVLGLALRFVGR